MKRHLHGLTLIELMVVVAVIAILATIAIISWGRFVQRAARSEAMSALEDLAVKQEQFRLAHPSYAAAVTAASLLDMFPTLANINANPTRKYELEILCGGTARFTATATRRAGTSQANDDCGTFAIDQDGPAYTVDADCNGAGGANPYDGARVADAECWRR